MRAHDKRAGGTNESDGAYRTSEFHARSPADGGDLFAARGCGSDVCGEFPLGHEGRFQELSEAFDPQRVHYITRHFTNMATDNVWNSAGVLQEVTYIPRYITLCTMAPVASNLLQLLYLLLTLVLDSLYHRLISMPPEMSIARPPWNSTLALRPDCSWITWR